MRQNQPANECQSGVVPAADITFQNFFSDVTDADLQRVADLIGFALPPGVARLYQKFNGGVPSSPAWELFDGEFMVVSKFLPMSPHLPPDRGTLESTLIFVRERQLIQSGLVPFATDWGGNYISFDAAGAVYFSAMDAWRPEESHEENVRRTTKRLAESFEAFVGGLEVDPDA